MYVLCITMSDDEDMILDAEEIQKIEEEVETPQRPKRKISQEHLQKMMEGRRRYLEAKKKEKATKKKTRSIPMQEEEDEVVEPTAVRRPKPKSKRKTKVVNNYYTYAQEPRWTASNHKKNKK